VPVGISSTSSTRIKVQAKRQADTEDRPRWNHFVRWDAGHSRRRHLRLGRWFHGRRRPRGPRSRTTADDLDRLIWNVRLRSSEFTDKRKARIAVDVGEILAEPDAWKVELWADKRGAEPCEARPHVFAAPSANGPGWTRTSDLGIKSPANVSNVSASVEACCAARLMGGADKYERGALLLLKPNPGSRSRRSWGQDWGPIRSAASVSRAVSACELSV